MKIFTSKPIFTNKYVGLVMGMLFFFVAGQQHTQAQTQEPFASQASMQGKDHDLEHAEVIQKKQLTYGQTLKMGTLADAVTWTIKGPNGNIAGKGNALNDYVFDKSGNYEIAIQENIIVKEGQCNHSNIPSSIQLKVDAVKMIFNQDELKLSADIRKGVDTRGIVLSIPVTIETLGEQNLVYTYTNVYTSGIGTNIVATLKKGTVLKVGKQVLQYELSGIAEKEAYIQFNFTDINGQVQIAVPKKSVL